MQTLLALMLCGASLADRLSEPQAAPVRAARGTAVGDRPRLPYRFDGSPAAAATATPARAQSRIDWQALDSSLAVRAEREFGRAPGAARESLWRGVPVIIVNGEVHGVW